MLSIRAIFVGLVFCFSTTAFGEVTKNTTVVATIAPAPPVTKAEAFLAKKGKIIIRDAYNIGEFATARQDRVRFTAVCAYEPNQESSKIKAMRIDVIDSHGAMQTMYLDPDEIATLINAAQYMPATAINLRGQIKEFTEMKYTTRSDFAFGFSQRGQQQTAFISAGTGGEKLFLRSVDDIKLIGENATKCVTTLGEK